MSFRKEKKFRLTFSDMNLLKASLLSKGMKNIYPERKVNSLYYDNTELRMFHHSDEGVLPRKKIRIRSYNNENKLIKEIKITSQEGRYKQTEPIHIKKSITSQFENLFDANYGLIIPTLLISYDREYFSLNNLRITFDSNIYYAYIRSELQSRVREPECVMEVKTSINTADDLIFKTINMQTSRFSKYCRGILMTRRSYL